MALRNATLCTVHNAPEPGVDLAITVGSLDVHLDINYGEIDRLMSADGETLEIEGVVTGGWQTEAGSVQAKRDYPALDCHGRGFYGPVTILGLVAGGATPILRVDDTIKLRVGPRLP